MFPFFFAFLFASTFYYLKKVLIFCFVTSREIAELLPFINCGNEIFRKVKTIVFQFQSTFS